MNSGTGILLGALAAFVTLAMVAVLVSQKAQTGSIISALTSGVASDIGAAVAPVTNS